MGGDRVDDGRIELKVTGRTAHGLDVVVVNGGPLGANKGINAPGVALPPSALTNKDVDDLNFGLKLGVDLVALSFVQTPDDVLRARAIIDAAGRKTPLVAKIERPAAVDNLDAILEVAQGVMVARGDLGLEMPLEQVPRVQKEVIRRARTAGRPSILATQVLESMRVEPRPTRAEVSDAANAVDEGADAIMLSGETALGAYPVRAVEVLCAATMFLLTWLVWLKADRIWAFRDATDVLRIVYGPFVYFMAVMIGLTGVIHLYRAARLFGVLQRQAFGWQDDPYAEPVPIEKITGEATMAIQTEVAVLRLGELPVACLPGELYPELVYGRFPRAAEPGVDFPDAPLETAVAEILPDNRFLLIGLANDEVGYLIPRRQWDSVPPFAYGRKTSQYGEINSCGPGVAPVIMAALRKAAE